MANVATIARPNDINVDTFKGAACAYRGNRKLVDALVGAGYGTDTFDAQTLLKNAMAVIGTLEDMSANGSTYTPDKAQGFGSSNAAVIADSILGRRKSAASIRSTFSKFGA